MKQVLSIMIGATALLTLMSGCTTPATSAPADDSVLVVPVYKVPKSLASSVNNSYWASKH